MPETTVQSHLDELQARRNADWTPDRVAAHQALRQSLEDGADRARIVKPGDVVEPFVLPEVDGGKVVLTELLEAGPVVLLFFRFEGCPACNAAFDGYEETLIPALKALGVQLVAISPQVPEKLVAIKQRRRFEFPVASDADASLLHEFGIAFQPDEEAKRAARAEGHDMGEVLGSGNWELPYPTVVVVGRDRVVHFADVHPNWMIRTESAAIVAAVESLLATQG